MAVAPFAALQGLRGSTVTPFRAVSTLSVALLGRFGCRAAIVAKPSDGQ